MAEAQKSEVGKTVMTAPNQAASVDGGITSQSYFQCAQPISTEQRCSATNPSNNMSDYEIVDTNADNIDGCSLCGNQSANNLGHRRKANWLKERYARA